MIISKLDVENGSLIDSVSGLQASIVGSKMKLEQTANKGFMLSNDGTAGNYVDIPNSETMTNTGDWSISVPIRVDSNKAYCGFINKNLSSWALWYYNTTLRFGINGVESSITISVIKPNIFYYVTINYKNGVLSTYINGVLKTSSSVTITQSAYAIRIASKTLSNSCMNGKIGTPRIYNHALTQKEIDDLYTDWLQPKPTVNLLREPITTLSNDYSKEVGIVAAYNGNLSGNLWLDKSGNGKHGTKVGTVVNSKNGISFNGKQLVQVTESGNRDSCTYCLRIINKQGNPAIINKNAGGVLIGISSNIPNFRVETSSIKIATSSKTVTPNTEFDLIMTYDGVNIKGYLNGELVCTLAQTGTIVSGTSLIIGGYSTTISPFIGEIKELLIYNRVLSTNEIINYHKKWIRCVLNETFNYGADNQPW